MSSIPRRRLLQAAGLAAAGTLLLPGMPGWAAAAQQVAPGHSGLSGASGIAGGAAFTPLSLSPVLWLRADLGLFQNSNGTTAATADADPVGYWADQSGNGNHVIQATSSKRPTLKLSIVNGQSVVRLDGVDDVLSNSWAIPAVASLSVVLRKRSAASGASRAGLTVGTAGGEVFNQTTEAWRYYRNEANATVTLGGTPQNWTVLTLVYASAASITPYVNGTAGAAFDPKNEYSATGLFLGAYSDGSEACDVDIAEVLGCTGALGAAALTSWHQYVIARYGIS